MQPSAAEILSLAKEKPSYYSISDYGIPINDLDSIATIGTFSATLIWLAFPRQGIFLRDQEITDYIALWRLIAHYLGTPTSYFSSPAAVKPVMESILLSEIKPSFYLQDSRQQYYSLASRSTSHLRFS
ncbi:hypothetical protein DID88_005722 [Monilinia fructigena]|uniref:ER-bound oxygenase mpaB/mpaB'/Rubber oxygenase catalytic domain-containing protein n=1 Tax=Monilinia fructigena TaxID=38457 RepID=A0A395J0N9_9HELO|nr:hypothetical protein DID88_005722 [Monilinia fructigena]